MQVLVAYVAMAYAVMAGYPLHIVMAYIVMARIVMVGCHARIHSTDSLPFSASGKVQRSMLAEPSTAASDNYAPTTVFEPTNPDVKLLAAVFEAQLGKGCVVSESASFFDLGGHSLLVR